MTASYVSQGELFKLWVLDLLQKEGKTREQIIDMAVEANYTREWATNRVERIIDELYDAAYSWACS